MNAPRRSEARAQLAELMSDYGTDGVLRLDAAGEPAEGAELPPGSMEYPPCRCPRCRPDGSGGA
ncbi:hypothetical protein [Streptomyces enissocaesilis]|uniref:Uncharacterized protein n=1 Tax=Streptomyces enissocaesilis TaxID=332589 RepID=A0ABN3XCU4_9ACTN